MSGFRSTLLIFALLPMTAHAQTPALSGGDTMVVITQAAATITAAEVTRHLKVLASDSLRDRPTPSEGLESTARYIDRELQHLGIQHDLLEFGGDPQSLIQSYPLPGQRRMGRTESVVYLLVHPERRGKSIRDGEGQPWMRWVPLSFASAVYLTPEVGPQTVAWKPFNVFSGIDPILYSKPVVVIAGPQTAATVRQMADTLREATALYIPRTGTDSAIRRQVITELYAVSHGVIVASDEDSAHFATQVVRQTPVTMVDEYLRAANGPTRWPWAATVWGPGVMRGILESTGGNLSQLQEASTPIVRVWPSVTAMFVPAYTAVTTPLATAPNVVGMLEGSDLLLKDEYIVISTHMDIHADTSGVSVGDHMPHETDSGIAGLLTIAQAFTQPGMRPRRSVIFLATSGGATDFSGANFFTRKFKKEMAQFKGSIDINLHLDGLGKTDSLVVDGLRSMELALSPEWIAATHPELGLSIIDGGAAAKPSSDHFPFVRIAVPTLNLHTNQPAAEASGGRSDAVDAERVARISRFAFYVSQMMATAHKAPRWTTEGRQLLRTVLEP